MGGNQSSGHLDANKVDLTTAAVAQAKQTLGQKLFDIAESNYFTHIGNDRDEQQGIPAPALADVLGVDAHVLSNAVSYLYELYSLPPVPKEDDGASSVSLSLYICIVSTVSNGRGVDRADLYAALFVPPADSGLGESRVVDPYSTEVTRELFTERTRMLTSTIAARTDVSKEQLDGSFSDLLMAQIYEGSPSLTLASLTRALQHETLFFLLMDDVFRPLALPNTATSVAPSFLNQSALNSELLSIEASSVINERLPVDYRSQWQLVFSDAIHGASFSKFRESIEDSLCVIVIRDTDGHVFGGFGSSPWAIQSQFFGADGSFVFSVLPLLRIYEPSGHNCNYQYYNYGAQSLPNGLAFGGQLNFFGLFIDCDFKNGHSKGNPSSTFRNPRLSKEEKFTLDKVEVWKVGAVKQAGPVQADGAPSSILDNRGQETALLEMAGKTMHSKHIREPPESESS